MDTGNRLLLFIIKSKSSSSRSTLLERPIWPSFGARCTILWGGLWSASTGPFLWLPRTIILGCREPVGGRRSGIPAMPYMSVAICVFSEGLSAWQDVFTRWVAVLDFRCLTSAMELAHLAVELHVESFLLKLRLKGPMNRRDNIIRNYKYIHRKVINVMFVSIWKLPVGSVSS